LEIINLLLLGAVAGTLAGLLGVGGGIVIVPVFVWIFQSHAEIPITHLMHIAIGTTLATIVITSTSSIIAHHRRGAVHWSIVWQFVPGIIIGALLGAVIADALPSETLQVIFAIFILFVSAQLGFGAQRVPDCHTHSQTEILCSSFTSILSPQEAREIKLQPIENNYKLPSKLGMGLTGAVIGSSSSLVGIGGGSVIVPFLAWCNVPIRNAVATSAACGFPIAVSGAVGFIATGWHVNDLPAFSSGYIYWPAFAAIAPTSLVFAPLGAKLTHIVPTGTLKNFFAVFLAGVGFSVISDQFSVFQ
jgi:uncharacterized protein